MLIIYYQFSLPHLSKILGEDVSLLTWSSNEDLGLFNHEFSPLIVDTSDARCHRHKNVFKVQQHPFIADFVDCYPRIGHECIHSERPLTSSFRIGRRKSVESHVRYIFSFIVSPNDLHAPAWSVFESNWNLNSGCLGSEDIPRRFTLSFDHFCEEEDEREEEHEALPYLWARS